MPKNTDANTAHEQKRLCSDCFRHIESDVFPILSKIYAIADCMVSADMVDHSTLGAVLCDLTEQARHNLQAITLTSGTIER